MSEVKEQRRLYLNGKGLQLSGLRRAIAPVHAGDRGVDGVAGRRREHRAVPRHLLYVVGQENEEGGAGTGHGCLALWVVDIEG